MLDATTYNALTSAIGKGFAVASLAGGEAARTEFYDSVYLPLIHALRQGHGVDSLDFSFHAARAEQSYIFAARKAV